VRHGLSQRADAHHLQPRREGCERCRPAAALMRRIALLMGAVVGIVAHAVVGAPDGRPTASSAVPAAPALAASLQLAKDGEARLVRREREHDQIGVHPVDHVMRRRLIPVESERRGEHLHAKLDPIGSYPGACRCARMKAIALCSPSPGT
jgi:hypothetical protein